MRYKCPFCPIQSKTKDDAVRHQDSVHLRRHLWSCAPLTATYDVAFHLQTAFSPSNTSNDPSSPTNMMPPDICGYCGKTFPNDPSPDWNARLLHLTNVHKIGECNQSKKFDHVTDFRQHLQFDHAGKSGKWTNHLEKVCRKDHTKMNRHFRRQRASRRKMHQLKSEVYRLQCEVHRLQRVNKGVGPVRGKQAKSMKKEDAGTYTVKIEHTRLCALRIDL